MPDTVRVDEAAGIIRVTSTGEVTREDIAGSVAAVREIYSERGLDRIVVDARGQTSMPGTAGIFELFSSFPRELKVCILFRDGQPTEEDLSFVETVSTNDHVADLVSDAQTGQLLFPLQRQSFQPNVTGMHSQRGEHNITVTRRFPHNVLAGLARLLKGEVPVVASV